MKLTRYILGIIGVILVSQFAVAQPYFDWVKSVGGAGATCSMVSIAADTNGNVYVTGGFAGTVDFDPGPGVLNFTSTGILDAFVSKYNSNGNLVWARITGRCLTSTDRMGGAHIKVDNNGDIVIGGSIQGSCDVDPGPGVQIQTSTGSDDWFIQKLDNAGNLIWANSSGSTSSDDLTGIVLSPNGDVYACGYFAGTTDFDPGAGTLNLTPNNSGWEAGFLYKLDASGNLVWVKSIRGTSGTYGWSVDLDAAGDVYMSGSFLGTADLDPNAGTLNATSLGSNDMFILKLTSAGLFSWAKTYGGVSNERGENMRIDNQGNIIISGFFQGTIDLDPGAGVSNVTSAGSFDIFIQKLDPSGNFVWGGRIGSANMELSGRLAVDSSNDIYMSGLYAGTMDFDPTGSSFNATSAGGNDSYVVKIASGGTFVWLADQRGAANSGASGLTVLGNNEVYLIGDYSGTTDFDHTASASNQTAAGTSDGFLLRLSQCLATSSLVSPTVCASYISPSGNYTWTVSGTYADTLQNATGCDSIITINLTILQPSSSTDIVSACSTYTWIDGNTYTVSNNLATHTLTNSAGCDSVVTLNLTIDTVDPTTTASNDSITSNAAGASYLWLDCNNNYAPIPGETGQTFVATASGNFAVQVTQGTCTDTSACVNVNLVSSEETLATGVRLYPNPTQSRVYLDVGKKYDLITVTTYNIYGQEVGRLTETGVEKLELSLPDEPGVYFVELVGDKFNRFVVRVLKY